MFVTHCRFSYTLHFNKFLPQNTVGTIMAFVYINGYPGVGKLTVANELTHVRPSVLAVIFVRLILVQETYIIIQSRRQP